MNLFRNKVIGFFITGLCSPISKILANEPSLVIHG